MREEKEEEHEREMRKMNIVINGLSESKKTNQVDSRRDDAERIKIIINDVLNLDIDNVFRLGKGVGNRSKPRPIRFSVENYESKRLVLSSVRHLRNHSDYSNVYFTPDLTAAYKLREKRRRRMLNGEENLQIRRGKIIVAKPLSGRSSKDHDYSESRTTSSFMEAISGRVLDGNHESLTESPPGRGRGRPSFR